MNKCQDCGEYTLKDTCACGGTAKDPSPAKYSPEDKYAAYRRQYKEEHA